LLEIKSVSKVYRNYSTKAVDNISLKIQKGEIFGLLGPNGAGKTSLISMICGLSKPSSGKIFVDKFDVQTNFLKARNLIGLVPQELPLELFQTVFSSLRFSRGLFGKKADDQYLIRLLKDLSLIEKKNEIMKNLSGGMKRRVLIAKALSHEPKLLFLDEPTAGVDVELRKRLWAYIAELKNRGMTVVLTTHYIEEAQAIADRIGIIDKGKLILVQKKDEILQRMGKKRLVFETKESDFDKFNHKIFAKFKVTFNDQKITFFLPDEDVGSFGEIVDGIKEMGIRVKKFYTDENSLEDIFLDITAKIS